jgi:hypothetical protein
MYQISWITRDVDLISYTYHFQQQKKQNLKIDRLIHYLIVRIYTLLYHSFILVISKYFAVLARSCMSAFQQFLSFSAWYYVLPSNNLFRTRFFVIVKKYFPPQNGSIFDRTNTYILPMHVLKHCLCSGYAQKSVKSRVGRIIPNR